MISTTEEWGGIISRIRDKLDELQLAKNKGSNTGIIDGENDNDFSSVIPLIKEPTTEELNLLLELFESEKEDKTPKLGPFSNKGRFFLKVY